MRHNVDSDDVEASFKAAMRRLAAAVTIITARSGGVRFGMTATAATSLTASPPTLLICINKSASIHDPIVDTGRFRMNVLGCEHSDLVGAFSGKVKGEERFENGLWSSDENGLPLLCDAQASLSCQVQQVIEVGTHSIFVGQVDEVQIVGDTAPLLYQEGSLYRSATLSARDK